MKTVNIYLQYGVDNRSERSVVGDLSDVKDVRAPNVQQLQTLSAEDDDQRTFASFNIHCNLYCELYFKVKLYQISRLMFPHTLQHIHNVRMLNFFLLDSKTTTAK